MRLHRIVGIVAIGALVFLSSRSLTRAQEPPAPAAPPAPSDIDALRKLIESQQTRIDQLEKNQQTAQPQLEEAITRAASKLQKQQKPTDFNVYWKDGLWFDSNNNAFKLHIGGRLQYDLDWIAEDADTREYVIPTTGKTIGDQPDGTELRRLRFQMDGTIYDNTFYKLEVDFTGNEKAVQKDTSTTKSVKATTFNTSTVILRDAFVGLKDVIPFATLQAGHFKEPFSLEQLTSDNYITFMERSLADTFAPAYNAGVQLSNPVLNDRATWAVGVFKETDDRGVNQAEGGYNVTGRVTALPWYENNGERLLHVGLSGSYKSADTIQFAQRPEIHLASKYVDTGTLAVNNVLLGGTEAALVFGPFSVQSEWMVANTEGHEGEKNNTFNGGYLQASYFLTGEHRNYRKSQGVFDRTRPTHNFGRHTDDGNWGWGAFELAGRASYLDLDDQVQGGKINDYTVGLNWYLNPNVRFTTNYILSKLHDEGGQNGGLTNSLGMRVQVDF